MNLRNLSLFASAALFASPALAQRVPDQRVDTGDPPGASLSTAPRIAASGNGVFAVWRDWRNGFDDIYFNRSLDGGASWGAGDTRLDVGDPPGSSASYAPEIAAWGSDLFVVWEDSRNGSLDIFAMHSSDNGASWDAAPTRIDVGDAPGASPSSDPRIAVTGSGVFVVWRDARNGADDIYFNRSTDGGTTWLPAIVRLDTGDAPGAADSQSPEIAAWGSSVYVAWVEYRNGLPDIYCNRSLDGGSTWLPADVRLDTGDAPGAWGSTGAHVAASGNAVYVCWQDMRNGATDILFNRSADSGTTWLPAPLRLDTGDAPGANPSNVPRIAASGGTVIVVWEDQRNGAEDILANRSADGGATWLPSALRIDTGDAAGSNFSFQPRIAMSGSLACVAWQDSRTAMDNIFANRSADGGATWLGAAVRLDTGKTAGSTLSFTPEIAAAGNTFVAIWEDLRNDPIGFTNTDIFANLPFGLPPYGTGKAGCGAYVPQLGGSGLPLYGQTIGLNVTQGLGGAGGVLLLGVAKASIPLGGGTLLVLPPMTMLPFNLGGTPGTCGAGVGSYPIGIPNNPLLVGLAFYFQALFLDLGAPGGTSMTNGVELWIG